MDTCITLFYGTYYLSENNIAINKVLLDNCHIYLVIL